MTGHGQGCQVLSGPVFSFLLTSTSEHSHKVLRWVWVSRCELAEPFSNGLCHLAFLETAHDVCILPAVPGAPFLHNLAMTRHCQEFPGSTLTPTVTEGSISADAFCVLECSGISSFY